MKIKEIKRTPAKDFMNIHIEMTRQEFEQIKEGLLIEDKPKVDWSVRGGVVEIPEGSRPSPTWFIHEQDRKTTEQKLQLLIKAITEATGLTGITYYEGIDMECWMAHDVIKNGPFCLAGILADDCKDLKMRREQIRKEEIATRMVKKAPRMPQERRKDTKPPNTQGKEKS